MGDDGLPDLAALIADDAATGDASDGCGFCRRRPELAATIARVLDLAAQAGRLLSSRRVLALALTQHPGAGPVSDPYLGKHLRYCEPERWAKVKKQ